REAVDPHTRAHREREVLRVCFEVVAHLVLGRERISVARERQAVEATEPRRREQPQRVPALPPRITHALARVEDHELQPALLQVMPDRQPRLAAPDHDRLYVLSLSCRRHRRLLVLDGLAQRGARIIGHSGGESPDWISSTTSKPNRSYSGMFRGLDDSRYAGWCSASHASRARASNEDPYPCPWCRGS